jgi:hypothetical protein
MLMAWLAGWWLIVGLWPASGQQAPPTENKGIQPAVVIVGDIFKP